MSLSRNRSFFSQYAQNSYASLINPEFKGAAKKYYNEKKQHSKVNDAKNKLSNEVAYMERMEKKMQQFLLKKKIQLRYTKEVTTRLRNDNKKKEWLQQHRQQQIKNKQLEVGHRKSQSMAKVDEARDSMLAFKRGIANMNREQASRIKEIKAIKQAQEWDMNRSRVSQIQDGRRSGQARRNQHYKDISTKSLNSYQSSIIKFKAYQVKDQNKITTLEKQLNQLNKKYNDNRSQVDSLDDQIRQIRRQSKLQNKLMRSSAKSRLSLNLQPQNKRQDTDFSKTGHV